MGKIVKVKVVDASGTALSNQNVSVGNDELTTGMAGMIQVLLDDGNTVLKVNGKQVYEGPVSGLQPLEVFTQSGARP
jgi:uncharacterized membrane protein